MNKPILRFKTDIDAAFALAYYSLGANDRLFRKRRDRFVEHYGKGLDGLMNTCNRRELDAAARDHHANALDCGRRHMFELAKKWVQGAEESHKEIGDIIDGLWE